MLRQRPSWFAVLILLLFSPGIFADENGVPDSFVNGLSFRSIGPAFMSGRISDIAVDPVKPNTWYVAAASGNVWKTENAGTTWTPIFDNYGSYSIGCISIDPNNHNTIWIGTGENDGGRHIAFGDGVYVSRDAGKSFTNVGLKDSEHISKILIHPHNSNIVYAASQGPLWSGGGQRGLYKSTDGGKTWNQVLSKGEYTGVTDVVMDPSNPDILYAATHQRHRTVWALLNGGPESGIFKSTDGGNNWKEMKSGIPGGDKGKICLAVSPQKHNVIYAGIELPGRVGGFFRSDDHGETWTKMSDYVAGGTGPHYYQEIWCDPHRFDSIYHADVELHRSDDGGTNFVGVGSNTKHVDNHAVAFHPADPDVVLVGCDGGLYRTYDRCKSWHFTANLPLTQFYKVAVDYDWPFYHVVGGTQDNNTQYGPTATSRVQGITNADWRIVIGGDGHDCAIDPSNPDIIYGESQQGYIRRFDRKTGMTLDIRPQPGEGEPALRFNWDSPIEISFHDPKRLYFGSSRLHRSDDQGNSWKTLSPDLSRNQNRFTLPIMGRVWSIDATWDLFAMSQYNNITSIGESPLDENLIYVGTDDGLIQVTEDGGNNWRKIDKIHGLPQYSFVNDIKACRFDKDTVYVCLDNHKYGDYKPYLMKSTDRGNSWEPMVGNLPDRHLVWRIIQDHEKADLFFLATEFGVFTSLDGGANWIKIKSGMPNISVRDLEIQRRENDLVAATFGRGFYVLDDFTPLRTVSPELLKENELHIFPVKTAKLYSQDDRLGGRLGWQGDNYFAADNPSFGAVFTFHLRDVIKTQKQTRLEAEQKANEAGKDVPTPSWEQLQMEERESAAQIVFTVRDSAGQIVDQMIQPQQKGLQRIAWPLRYSWGPNVAPGQYTVSAERVIDGIASALGNQVTFEVQSIDSPSLPQPAHADALAFYKNAYELMQKLSGARNSLATALSTVQSIQTALQQRVIDDKTLVADTKKLQTRLLDVQDKMTGDSTKAKRQVELPPSMIQRVQSAMFGSIRSGYGPTQTHRDSMEIARKQYSEIYPELSQLIETELREIEQRVEKEGIYGIGGRTVPKPSDN
jgi:photosystem II stability/assembly factor-like uncharacterized protein